MLNLLPCVKRHRGRVVNKKPTDFVISLKFYVLPSQLWPCEVPKAYPWDPLLSSDIPPARGKTPLILSPVPLLSKPDALHPVLNLMGFSLLPACRIQTSDPAGMKGHLTSFLQSLPRTDSAASLYFCHSEPAVSSSPRLSILTNKLLPVASVQWKVSCVRSSQVN